MQHTQSAGTGRVGERDEGKASLHGPDRRSLRDENVEGLLGIDRGDTKVDMSNEHGFSPMVEERMRE